MLMYYRLLDTTKSDKHHQNEIGLMVIVQSEDKNEVRVFMPDYNIMGSLPISSNHDAIGYHANSTVELLRTLTGADLAIDVMFYVDRDGLQNQQQRNWVGSILRRLMHMTEYDRKEAIKALEEMKKGEDS